MSIPTPVVTEIQTLEPSAVIELFSMDMSAVGGPVVNYHGGTSGKLTAVVWQGVTYYPFPVQASGFEFNGRGQLPRPKITFANVTSAITALILQYGDPIGCKVTRKRTLAKFLDAANFPLTATAHYQAYGWNEGRSINKGGQFNPAYYLATYWDIAQAYTAANAIQHFVQHGIAEGRNGNATGVFSEGDYLTLYPDVAGYSGGYNPTADPTAHFPDDIYFIEQRTAETREAVEFQLAAAFDFQGLQLPRRPIIQNVCIWKYRGPECGWTGGPATIDDVPTLDWSQDACSKRLAGCKCRFGPNSPLPYGAFPSAGAIHV